MSLLDASFDWDDSKLDKPLLDSTTSASTTSTPNKQFVRNRTTIHEYHLTHALFPSQEPKLINFTPDIIPLSSNNRNFSRPTSTSHSATIPRSPSPLKNHITSFDYELGLIDDQGVFGSQGLQEEEGLDGDSDGYEDDDKFDSPFARDDGLATVRQVKIYNVQPDPESSFALADRAESYSPIAAERGSFLLDDAEDFTLSSFSLPNNHDSDDGDGDNESSNEHTEGNSTVDMRNLLRGLGDSLIGGRPPSSLLLPPGSTTNSTSDEARREKELLAASTASYRDYRDSPMKLAGLLRGDEQTPMRKTAGGRRFEDLGMSTPDSGSGSGGESSGDVRYMLSNWQDGEEATEPISSQNPPTALLHPEPTLTFELGLQSPLQPTRPLSSASSVVSPKSLFSTMKANAIRPLSQVAFASPRRIPRLSAGEDLIGLFDDQDFPGSKVTTAAKKEEEATPSESGTDRIRRKLVDLNRKKGETPIAITSTTPSTTRTPAVGRRLSALPSPALSKAISGRRTSISTLPVTTPRTSLARPRPSLTTPRPTLPTRSDKDRAPLVLLTTSSSRPRANQALASSSSSRRLETIHDDEAESSSKENAAPIASRMAAKPRLSVRPQPPSARKPPVGNTSPRKESTTERLQKAKEERGRREAVGGALKSRASISTSTSRTALPASGQKAPAMSLADALASKKSTSLASRSSFNPLATSRSRMTPRPSLSTSTSSSSSTATVTAATTPGRPRPSLIAARTPRQSLLPPPPVPTTLPKKTPRTSTVFPTTTGKPAPRMSISGGPPSRNGVATSPNKLTGVIRKRPSMAGIGVGTSGVRSGQAGAGLK
ncbi:hypothetical protein P7C70_g626, partial [Phenoliferia sp. Uapishka_3]